MEEQKTSNPSTTRKKRSTSFPRKKDNWTHEDVFSKKAVKDKKASPLPDGESNPGLPRDRRGYSPLYYRGLLTNLLRYSSPNFLDQMPIFLSPMMLQKFCSNFFISWWAWQWNYGKGGGRGGGGRIPIASSLHCYPIWGWAQWRSEFSKSSFLGWMGLPLTFFDWSRPPTDQVF